MKGNERLTDEQLAEIRKRAEATSAKFWMVKYGLGEGAEVNTGHGFGSKNVCVTQFTADAEFIAHAREDVPKLLAEIERLQSVNKALRVLISADATPNDNVIMDIFGDKIKESAKKIADELRRKLGDPND